MTEKILEELDTIQEEIEKAKREKAQSEGKLDSALSRLEREFNLQSSEEGIEEYNRLQKKEEELKTMLQEQYQKLKEGYEW